MTPPALDRAVKKSLAKIPDERWQSASDLASELNWIGETEGKRLAPRFVAKKKASRERAAWIIAGVSVLALIAVGVLWRNSKPSEPTMYFTAPMSFSR